MNIIRVGIDKPKNEYSCRVCLGFVQPTNSAQRLKQAWAGGWQVVQSRGFYGSHSYETLARTLNNDLRTGLDGLIFAGKQILITIGIDFATRANNYVCKMRLQDGPASLVDSIE
ncbi:hypothetical protein JL37_29205 [Achromobacter sp. RTa]|nr:hypothetical protein JL37_29205 [Achromobacter sp. RTa]